VLLQDCTLLAQQDRAIPTLKSRNQGIPAAPAQYDPLVL